MAAKVWLKGEEIDKASVSFQAFGASDPVKLGFMDEVILRLEQTESDKVVRFLFPSKELANAYRNYVKQRAVKKLGTGFLLSQIMPTENGKWWVAFTRGPSWRKIV